MMTNEDAELLLDENFIATEQSHGFDSLGDESNRYYAESKYKKKNGFSFTSSWRSPKIGRRITRSIRKDPYDRTFNERSPTRKTKGKYVKDRESFESMASVPLSDFDYAKDTLPFLHFQSDNSDARASMKEKTALNPKMFLTQPSGKRRETKSQVKKEKNVHGKLDGEESRDIFKPIHNNNITFDAFQLHSKESPKKVTGKDEIQQKQQEEEPDDLLDKENFSQGSIYCGDLYQDHGPILSSLSEDTINSHSVIGEKFLEDEISPKNRWEPAYKNVEQLQEEKWGFRDANDQNEMQRVETIQSAETTAAPAAAETSVRSFPDRTTAAPATVETSARSFSDRLKLFQSKTTQPAQPFRYEPSTSKSTIPVGSLLGPKVAKHEEEAKNNMENTIPPETSQLENPPSDVQKSECDISKPDEQGIVEVNQVSSSELKRNGSGRPNSFDRSINSSAKETKARISSYTDDKKSLTANKFRAPQNLGKIQSKVVDLSLIETYRNQAGGKDLDRKDSAPSTNTNESTLCSEEEKTDSMQSGKESESNCGQIESGLPRRNVRPYGTNYRSSSNSQQSVNRWRGKIPDRQDSKSAGVESASTPEDPKMESSEVLTRPLEIVSAKELDDDETPVAKQAPLESKINKSEIRDKEPRDSFRAATLRFGGKFAQSENKYGRKIVPKILGSEKKEISEEEERKEKPKDPQNSVNDDDVMVVSKSDPVDSKKSGSSGTEVNVDSRTTSSYNEVQKNPIALSVTNLEDRDHNLKRSQLTQQSEKRSVGHSAPSLQTRTSITNTPDATSLESENKEDPKREISNDSTANTSVSTLTCDSAVPTTSFAQQSASIFGVTLSKTRKSRMKNLSAKKEPPLSEKPNEVAACAEKPKCQDVLEDSQMIRPKTDVIENNILETQKQNVTDEEHGRRKKSTSSVSIYSVDKKPKDETLRLKQEEGTPVVEHSENTRPKMSSYQDVKSEENDGAKPLDGIQSNASEKKEKPVFLPRKVKTSSISDRLKMFEQATTRSRISSNKDSSDVQETARTDSPKSADTSGSPYVDGSSISTKRRSINSEIESVDGILQNEPGEVETLLNKSHRDEGDDIDNDEIGDRRKTLKSNRGVMRMSGQYQPQPSFSEVALRPSNQSKVPPPNNLNDNVDDSLNKLEDGAKKLNIAHTEKRVEQPEKFEEDPSPPTRTAYSARRKFFENLDRKRVQASMSRPLMTQTEPMTIHNKTHQEPESELFNDDSLHESNDLPMFVEVEEDFMLRDNISTCLSASESRSVVCRPDTLLYSVSQKAIALMSAKAESNAKPSFSRNREEKETIHNDLDNERRRAQGLQSKQEESPDDVSAITRSQLRSRFARNKAASSKKKLIDDAEAESDKDVQIPVENGQANKFRTSDFSQRSNRFVRQSVQSKYKEALRTSNIHGKNDAQNKTVNSMEESKKSKSCDQNRGDEIQCVGKNSESAIEDEEILQKEKTPLDNDIKVEPDSPKIRSMSIRERRKFFENCKKTVSAPNRSSSFNNGTKVRPSEGSEMTPLVGANIVENSESEVEKRTSSMSMSMGTLDYSLPSSNSRPSSYRKGFSSSANRFSASSQGKKPDLRCF